MLRVLKWRGSCAAVVEVVLFRGDTRRTSIERAALKRAAACILQARGPVTPRLLEQVLQHQVTSSWQQVTLEVLAMTPVSLARLSFQEKLDGALQELRTSLIAAHSGVLSELFDPTSSVARKLQENGELPDDDFMPLTGSFTMSQSLPGTLTPGKVHKCLPPLPDGEVTPWMPPPPKDQVAPWTNFGDNTELADPPPGDQPVRHWTPSWQSHNSEGSEHTKKASWMGGMHAMFGGRSRSKGHESRSGSKSSIRDKDPARIVQSTDELEVVDRVASLHAEMAESGQESACSSLFGVPAPVEVHTPQPPQEEPLSLPVKIKKREGDRPQSPGSGSNSLEVPGLKDRPKRASLDVPSRREEKSPRSNGMSQTSNSRSTFTAIEEDKDEELEHRNGSIVTRGSRASLSRMQTMSNCGGESSERMSSMRAQPLDLLPAWQWVSGQDKKRSQTSFLSMPSMYMSDIESVEGKSNDGDASNLFGAGRVRQLWRHMVVSPTSKKRLAWDLFSMCFLLYDYFTIPLQVFDLPDSDFSAIMIWMTRVFWTIDIPASFFTGYLEADGEVEMRPECIGKKYLRTWLIIDFFVVGGDWAIGITEAIGNAGRVAGSAKVLRMFRVFRLMRIMKLPEKVAQVATMGEVFQAEKFILVLGVLKLISMVLGCAHLIACFWYGIGKACENAGLDNWLAEGYFDNSLFAETYAMSFHWSLTQFVGGTEIVQARNVWERWYAIVVVLMTFMISAAVVSSLTSSLTRIQFLAGQRTAQLAALRRYLADHNIPRKLMVRVQRNAQHALAELQRNVPESEVELLKLISEPIRVELHYEEHSPVLALHPLFSFYKDLNPAAMRKVCHEACKHVTYSVGDVLFTTGEVPNEPKFFILTRGGLDYHRENTTEPVTSGMVFAEATLWCMWVHRGVMRATLDSRLLTVDATTFQDIGNQFQHGNASIHPGLYAVEFQERLRQDRDLCSDLINPQVIQDLVNNLADPPEERGGSSSIRKSRVASTARTSFRRNSRSSRKSGMHNDSPASEMSGFELVGKMVSDSGKVGKMLSVTSRQSRDSAGSFMSKRSSFNLVGSMSSKLGGGKPGLSRFSVG